MSRLVLCSFVLSYFSFTNPYCRSVSVFGATGAQGGSVARALLKDNKWKVVALTRDVNSEKAKELKNMGAELRACDMMKPEDVEAAVKV